MTAAMYGAADRVLKAGDTMTGPLTVPGLQLTASPASGSVLTSDAAGNASWKAPGTDAISVKPAAKGDGTTDDTTAIQATLNSATAGQVVYLPGGTYRTSAPLTIPPGVALTGPHGNHADTGGVSIKPLASFSGTAVISMVDQATGSYSAVSAEQQIRNLNVDGSALAGGNSVHGILATGYVHSVAIDNVQIASVGGNGITGASNASGAPSSWRVSRVLAKGVGGYGFSVAGFIDSTWYDLEALSCTGSGIYFNASAANSHLTDCRAERNGSHGVELTGAWATGTGAGGLVITGLSTDRNAGDGLHITATGTVPVIVNGGMFRRDGRNGGSGGGSFAGIAMVASTIPVIINSVTVFPGVDDNGTGTNSPQYGIKVTSSAQNVTLTAGYVQGATTGVYDDGTNTNYFRGPNVLEATGTTSSPTTATSFPWSSRGQQTVALTTDSTALLASTTASGNANPLIDLRATSSTGAAENSRATGDANARFQRDMAGKMSWGPGSAATDTTLYRNGAGQLKTDGTLQAGNMASAYVEDTTSNGITNTSYAAITTPSLSATATVPPSGRLRVYGTVRQDINANHYAISSFNVTGSVSGAIRAPSDAFSLLVGSTGSYMQDGNSLTIRVSSTNIGETITVTWNHKVDSAGGSATIYSRSIGIEPLLG
ncbi:glycosyl hydrolase family 28-related protein [Kitasatospora sp. NPDC059408]|uniref:glycosyl hydrolase family 28-related protein n=1 Tax=Kitasatospora sp. NPDC059408 TaxID=3346823 RepID=UPI003685FF8C